MYYTSVINIHTTPSNDLVLFWLLCVSVVLMISPEVFTIYVAITIKMVFFIDTDASTDSISFIICLITRTSTILISPMITFISTILIALSYSFTYWLSAWWSYPYLPYWLSAWSYPFPPLADKLGSLGLVNTEGFLFWSGSSLSSFIVCCTRSPD